MSGQNYKPFWDEALKLIKDDLTKKGELDQFKIWYKMEYISDTLSEINVRVASLFMWNQMNDLGIIKTVQDKLNELTGQTITLTCTFGELKSFSETETEENSEKQSENNSSFSTSKNSFQEEKVSYNTNTDVQKNVIKEHPQLNPNFTFDKFVTDNDNNFAYSVAYASSKNPGKAYNPILIYGGVGLGKTHLMQAIGNDIYQNHPDMKICCVAAENFTNEFTMSLRKGNGAMEEFQKKYRNTDVLLLDDIHFLMGKPGVQAEIFYTFESLFNNKSQMVFTCDRPISELKDIEERLLSRFSRGISVDLKMPGFETRVAIIEKKLESLDKHLPKEIIDFTAKNVKTNIRDLESCIITLTAYQDLTKTTLTESVAKGLLQDTFSKSTNESVSIETIQKVVADHYNISLSDMKSSKRNQKVLVPRKIAIYIARNLLGYSYPELGAEFGGRDHTTILHSYTSIEDGMKIDSSLASTVKMLIRTIKEYGN